MESVEFRGEPGDLRRFARHVLKRTITVDQLSPFEFRMRWAAHGNSGSSSTVCLRSGIKLNTTKLSWDRPWAFRFRNPATPLKFLLGRGPGPQMTPSTGPMFVLGEGMLQVASSRLARETTCEFIQGGAECAQLALEIEPGRLKELLGAPSLPAVLETLLAGTTRSGMHEQPAAPSVFRLLEEVLHADSRGISRQLFLEAKGLELLAVLIDELSLISQAMSPFGQRDLERLECARRLLLEHIDAPPSLPELARHVGLNEVKLKTGFRALFGTSAFAYLRAQRMERARRLLVQRGLSVTEVALRVGYANPSKFASAFRKHFGFPPSALR
ncbi:MAG TPA: AraC family transcriptional regulator [Polyangiaceae bacterium]|nr:AraC family transcriptional regulator [Polyangiaceae bacterium]